MSVFRRAPRLATLAILALALHVPEVSAQGDGNPPPAPPAAKSSGTKKAPAPATQRRRPRRSTTTRRAAARTPALPALRPTAPRSAASLSADLSALLNARVRSGAWGAMVVSLTRGDTLFSIAPDDPRLPASTMKLLTTALAFDRFGPDHQFTTDVLREGAVGPAGTLEGNLVLRGGGDPALSNRVVRNGVENPMGALANLVAASGIKRVHGDLIGDASAFDARRVPDGWLSRYLEAGYAARVSALSLNENLVTVVITPGGAKGGATVALEPATSTIGVVNNVRSVAGSGARVLVRRLPDGRVEARGTIGTRSSPRAYQLVVDDPAVYATGALRAALAARGITVTGQVRMARTPANAVSLGSLASPPLATLASVMNRESINHFAELLFRNVAHAASPDAVGSAENANGLLKQFMAQKVGARDGSVLAADGSGLSTLDRVTPRAMVQLLGYAHAAPWASQFHSSLPVAGESELLRHRMRSTAAQGNLHAKTGTTNDVIGLAGYVTAEDGEVMAFAFLYNGRDRWNAREAIDASGATMAAFARP
jgi:D-alanyl-D-alanine carboxypeptidase/D-alanyl-D-alanine-endopeptidase (penicillin-binding protein 4)